MVLLERQRVCKCLSAVFQPDRSPLITGSRSKASEEKQEWEKQRHVAGAVPGGGHMQGCSDLAFSRTSVSFLLWDIPGQRTESASFIP